MTKIILRNILTKTLTAIKNKLNSIIYIYVLNVTNGYEVEKYKA